MIPPPIFPEDLEREIFVIAAESSHKCAAALARVEKKVNLWVTPILYRVLTFNDLHMCLFDESFLLRSHHVQQIHSTVGMTLITSINHFSNLKTLVLFAGFVDAFVIRKITELPLLQELWLNLTCRLDPYTFSNLTHLGIFNKSLDMTTFPSNSFPNLTHLLLSFVFEVPASNSEILFSILDGCIHLEVLLIQGGALVATLGRGMDAIEQRFHRRDERIVEYWLGGIGRWVLEKSLATVWKQGEQVVNARRSFSK
ncbi:hypothetical protein BDN72DRAFT_903740 [Pluteus cervinus]|uniref:Uncharacterized protein n=1 Tax=Pluteus cervinus TaxID=181527 RepID=A0ACD3A844_9AGAR|nr:hypothetical protein BDN72DRAFT_903740 [Pluteus cervinus]